MRIAFCCNTLEPGTSGVGDYTLRLSAALKKQGWETCAISFNDSFVKEELTEERKTGNDALPISRIPSSLNARVRSSMVVKHLQQWQPDWTSLQFVPYSFQSKGFVSRGTFPFRTPAGGKHHLMFHELWIGQHPGASLRDRAVGALQRFMCRRAVRAWAPRLSHTSCKVYQALLARSKVAAGLLPMFGTVEPTGYLHDQDSLWSRLVFKEPTMGNLSPERVRIAGVFGANYDSNGLKSACQKLIANAQLNELHLVICFLGRSASSYRSLCASMKTHTSSVSSVILDSLDDDGLIATIGGLNLGIVTTPLDAIGKSSAAATLRDQGIPVLSCSRGAYWSESSPPYYWVDDFVAGGLLKNPPKFQVQDSIDQAAKQLIFELGQA